MIKTCAGVLLAVAVLGCSSDSPPGATVALAKTLPDSPLARMQNASLIRAGGSFTLAGYENGRVQWGRLSLDGVLSQETGFDLAQPVLGPIFAATMKSTPGDQLVAIVVTNSATVSGGYDLLAIVQTLGDPTPAAPVLLAPPLPVGTDPSTVQIAAGAATSGNVGFVAWGIRVPGIQVSYLLLPADAVTSAAPSQMFAGSAPADVPDWDCLQTTGGTTGLGFSVVTPGSASPQYSDFDTLEFDEAGNAPFMTYQLNARVVNCNIVGSPTPEGNFFLAFQSPSAIDFATYYPDPTDPNNPGTVTTHDPVLPAALFGGPLGMPHPAWVISAGGDVSIGLDRTAGPEVVRFTYNAVPHGATLLLPSANGQTGPVSAWVGPDAAYVTYSDQVKGSGSATSVMRYFMRVESPASLP
jgi:hypothetical protein